ncbi:hypothetical protein OKW29_002650 [Paraburkholderia sp. CI3]
MTRPRRSGTDQSLMQSAAATSYPSPPSAARTDHGPLSARCQAPFTASLNALPAVDLTVFAAAIWISAPVAGLRPTRAARAPVENEPNPISCTVSP